MEKAKVRMMKQNASDQTESYWNNLWGKPRGHRSTGERELYYVFQSGVVENVGVHVVYKEAEEQALSSIYYNSEEDDQRRPPQQPQQQKA
ncbi:hypothetical protein CsSME_00051636 [Camellia sinensis var. sinensis]